MEGERDMTMPDKFGLDGTILSKLNDERVFSVEPLEDGFLVSEECDSHFAAVLTAYELRQLADELRDVADGKVAVYHWPDPDDEPDQIDPEPIEKGGWNVTMRKLDGSETDVWVPDAPVIICPPEVEDGST
jgi:hypothetical protein